MNALRSLIFATLFYSGSFLYVLGALGTLAAAPAKLPALVARWSAFHRLCVRRLLGIRVQETGTRLAGPALYAIKHESFFEAIDLPVLLGQPAVFAKEELFAIPGWGRAAKAYGIIPVARRDGARTLRAMVHSAREVAQQGRPLVIFPEGTRVPHGRRAPLQAGFAALYKALGLPVVPVAVDSGRSYGKGVWKRTGVITVHFGDLVPPGLPRAELEAQVLAAINALNPPLPPAGEVPPPETAT